MERIATVKILQGNAAFKELKSKELACTNIFCFVLRIELGPP